MATGCGTTYTQENIQGKKYLFQDESADSRTIEFKTGGTFKYDIVTARETRSIAGQYTVNGSKLTLKFGQSERVSELSEDTMEFKIVVDGKHLTDPEGLDWMQL